MASTLTPRLEEILPAHATRRKKLRELVAQHPDIRLHIVTTYDGKAAAVAHVGEDGKRLAPGTAMAPKGAPPSALSGASPAAASRLKKLLSEEGVPAEDREEILQAAKKIHGDAPGEVTKGDVEAAVAATHHGKCDHQGYLLHLRKGHSLNKRSQWKRRYFILREGFLLHYTRAEEIAPTGWIRVDSIRSVRLVSDGVVLPGTSEPVSNCFEVTLPSHSLVMRGRDSADVRNWMEKLFQARALQKKQGSAPRRASPKRSASTPSHAAQFEVAKPAPKLDDAPMESKDEDSKSPEAVKSPASASGGGGPEAKSDGTGFVPGDNAVDVGDTWDASGDVWDEFHDADTDQHYWINRRTAEMSWAPPEHSAHEDDGVSGMEWVVKWDADGKAHYFYRPKDGSTSSTVPPEAEHHYGDHIDAHKDLTVHGGEASGAATFGESNTHLFASAKATGGDDAGGGDAGGDGAGGGAGGSGGISVDTSGAAKVDAPPDGGVTPMRDLRDVPGILGESWQQNARRQARRRSVVMEVQQERAYREKHRAEELAREHAVKLERETRAHREALKAMRKAEDRKRFIAELDEEHREALGIAEAHADDHDELVDIFTKIAIGVSEAHRERARVTEQWFEMWSVEWSLPYYINAKTNESQWDVPEGDNVEIVQYSQAADADM